MMHPVFYSLIALATIQLATGYKILIIPFAPGFNSRLLNVQKIADILAEDGHDVSVLINTDVSDHVITKQAKVLQYKVPEDIFGVDDVKFDEPSWDGTIKVLNILADLDYAFCDHLLKDRDIMKHIQTEHYDLIFADMGSFCSQVLISNLNVTAIYYYNVLVTLYSQLTYPVFPSFTCILPGLTCNDEHMTFTKRATNFLMKFAIEYITVPTLYSTLKDIATKNGVTLYKPIEDSWKNKVVVINGHFALETALPLMPSVFLIPGLFDKEPEPLPKDFADIVKASEPHGTILMSFGTLMPEIDAGKAELFARILGSLPQQVIWRFTGKPPNSLKPNIHLVQWFPQTDLLAHPSVKLLITHCGISSSYESATHGIPILALPLFIDQHGNAAKLTNKLKMGVTLDFYNINDKKFEQGLKEVLSNPVYAENAKKASNMLNNRLVSPKHQLRHLVNFTIASGGAPHLFHPYASEMNLFQYYGLDVLLFIVSIILGLLLVMFTIFRICIKKFTKVIFSAKVKRS